MHDSSKKVALVTGAGMIVLLGARDAALGEEAAAKLHEEKLDVRLLQLDLVRPETIAAAAASIAGEFQHLDILVNNAAIVDQSDGPPSSADLNSVKRIMATNFFGTLAVT